MAKTEDLAGIEGEGVSPKKIKALTDAIDEWRGIVEKRMALTKKEVAARDFVLQLMHKHSLTKYPYQVSDEEERILVVEGTEKLKLKKLEEAEEPSETDVNDD